MWKLLLTTTALVATSAVMAMASPMTDSIVAQLQAQGFDRIEVREGPNQVKVEASNGSVKFEAVYNVATGAVLKQETYNVGANDDLSPGVDIESDDSDFVDGSDDSSDDNGGDDSSDDNGSDDNSSDDNGGDDSSDDNGSDDSSDDNGSDDDSSDDNGSDDNSSDDNGGDDDSSDDDNSNSGKGRDHNNGGESNDD